MDLSLQDKFQGVFLSILLFISGWAGVLYIIKYYWHIKPPTPIWKIFVYVPLAIILPFALGIKILYDIFYK